MTLTYNGNSVRQQNPDLFLLSLFTPRKYRKALWALFALHHEIAKTHDVVSEPQIGLIRLQWWREAIANIYSASSPHHHEVIKDLAQTINTHDLPQSLFEQMIVAHEEEFHKNETSFKNLEQLQHHVSAIYTPLLKLTLQILRQNESDEMIQKIAMNYGLINIIRSVSYFKRRAHSIQSQDILEQIKTDHSSFLKSKFLRKLDKMILLYQEHILSLKCDFSDPRFTLPPRFMAFKLLCSR